ncbi:MAG TPA: methyl-accepting chemotaxis protein [Azospirillaceae bacterium]|nr:methyl-accepting chemotaxis protein [Azospirillaceae bacterium]
MTRILRLSDWRISAKVLLAPALGLAALLGIAGYGSHVLYGEQRVLDALVADVFEDARAVSEFQGRLSGLHADLYRVLGVAANYSDLSALKKDADTASARLNELEAAIGQIRAVAHNPDVAGVFGLPARTQAGDAQKELEAVQAELAAYKAGVIQVTDILTADAGVAMILMSSAEDAYAVLLKRLVELERRTQDLSREASSAAQKGLSGATVTFFALAFLGVIFTSALTLFAARAISRPVVRLTGAMQELAGGTIDIAVPFAERADEIGAMARALAVFRDGATERQRLEAAQAEERRAKEERARAIDGLLRAFDGKVSDALAEVTAAGEQMRQAAERMAQVALVTDEQSRAAAAASEATSGNVQTVAAATEELSSSIQEIGQRVTHSTQIAQRAVGEAEGAEGTVRSLAHSANRIGEVVDLIQSIAGQTNLLALNATIEAARAGEAGKGFAVVASEVKNLAAQTAKATEEIQQQIDGVRGETGRAVAAIREIGGTIARISEITTGVAAAVEEQAAATSEIARNTQQAAAGTTEVAQNITGVTQAAQETGAAAAQMLDAAGGLAEQAQALKVAVERYVADNKAA